MPKPDLWRLVLASGLLLTGCNDTRDLAPASPSTPWQFQVSEKAEHPAVARGGSAPGVKQARTSTAQRRFVLPRDPALPWPAHDAATDPDHVYSLAELIDVAQRNSKETRVAWEQARQAAIGVGIARAAYMPELTASALAGYRRSALPFPTPLDPRGYITSNGEGFFPALALRYLLFDFGAAHATVQTAREISFAANVAFTGAHQRLIFEVSRAYFMLDGADAQLHAAQQSLANAALVQRAAEDRTVHGVGTVVDVALARRGTEQARFEITRATSAQRDAVYALLAAMGLPPTTKLRVADSFARPLPRGLSKTVDTMMHDALKQRPDLLADLARLRAADAGVALARASFYPKLSVSADVNGNIGQISVNGGPNDSIAQPEAGVYLRFDWPIYKGGLRLNQLHLAQSQRDQAEDSLDQSQDQAMREVAMAYDQLATGLMQYDAAVALEAASQTAFNAASDAYAHGVGSLTDATNAQTALADARASAARAHSQTLVDAAALAFSTGDLTGSAP